VPKHTAQWNPQTQLWETDQADLFSEQQEPYSETWPTSGMTRNGQLLPLPTSGHRTDANACSSLLPTPAVNDMGDRVNSNWDTRQTLEWWDQFIAKHKAKGYNGNGHGRSLSIEVQRAVLDL
jgi:hypothetical protein